MLDQESALRLARATIDQELDALQELRQALGDAFFRCAQLLSGCSGLIWVTGVGTSAAVGARFAHNLTCCGARSMFLSPSDGLHGHTGVINPNDLLVAMSRGGESSEVNQMVETANRMAVKTIAFVHATDSTLARICDCVLPVQTKTDYELMGYVATTSTVAFSAMCDALCAVVLKVSGYTPDRFGRTHPGGAVGKTLASAQNDRDFQL
jgi:arabinose-5-phosphate isomerase